MPEKIVREFPGKIMSIYFSEKYKSKVAEVAVEVGEKLKIFTRTISEQDGVLTSGMCVTVQCVKLGKSKRIRIVPRKTGVLSKEFFELLDLI